MAREAIFICYRREDTADVAGRIYDALARAFGRQRIFKDVDNLWPGTNFGEYIRSMLPRCRVALVLIGPDWLYARDEHGQRRLDDPYDWVRTEIELALAAPGLDVVPVLLNGAQMPHAGALPHSLRPLLERHAAVVRRDPDFHDDIARLIRALRANVRASAPDLASLYEQGAVAAPKAAQSPPAWLAPVRIIGAAVAVAFVVGWLVLSTQRAGEAVKEDYAQVYEETYAGPPADAVKTPAEPVIRDIVDWSREELEAARGAWVTDDVRADGTHAAGFYFVVPSAAEDKGYGSSHAGRTFVSLGAIVEVSTYGASSVNGGRGYALGQVRYGCSGFGSGNVYMDPLELTYLGPAWRDEYANLSRRFAQLPSHREGSSWSAGNYGASIACQ